MKRVLLVVMAALMMCACGDTGTKKKIVSGASMEGRWKTFELGCHREIEFLDSQFFTEYVYCPDKGYQEGTGIYSRSQDGVITLRYKESSCSHLRDTEISAFFEVGSDKVVITDLEKTFVLHRVSGGESFGGMSPSDKSKLPPYAQCSGLDCAAGENETKVSEQIPGDCPSG